MSILEVATADIEATAAQTPRVMMEPATVRRLSAGNVVMVRTSDNTPETDFPVYFEEIDRNSDNTRFRGYHLTPNGGIADYISQGLSINDIVSLVATDYYDYQRLVKYTGSKGMFFAVPMPRLPDTFKDSAEAATGHRPARYTTWAEVLEVRKSGDSITADIRVFTNNTDTPEAREYGTFTAENFQQWDVEMRTDKQFRDIAGLAAEVWQLGKLYYIDAELHTVTALKGTIAEFTVTDESTGEPTGATVNRETRYSNGVVFAADSKESYVSTLPSPEVLDSLMLLSRNTVTRALKHADSNNYCSETAVALTGAGHVMPEVVITGQIVIDIDIKSKEYMLLRRLFGAANDDMSNLSDVIKSQWHRVAGNIPGIPERLPDGAKVELAADINWKAPKLRPLS